MHFAVSPKGERRSLKSWDSNRRRSCSVSSNRFSCTPRSSTVGSMGCQPRRLGTCSTDRVRATSTRERPSIVGRADEVQRLAALMDHVSAGRGGLALITGEPGIGKTCLAEEAARHANEAGVAVHWGRCSELDGAPAFWPWVQVLRSVWATGEGPAAPDDVLAALVPGLGSAAAVETVLDGDAARFRLYDAVTQYLIAASAQHPFVIVVDDLHWADVASLRLLRFLAPHVATASLAIVATSPRRRGVAGARRRPRGRCSAAFGRALSS